MASDDREFPVLPEAGTLTKEDSACFHASMAGYSQSLGTEEDLKPAFEDRKAPEVGMVSYAARSNQQLMAAVRGESWVQRRQQRIDRKPNAPEKVAGKELRHSKFILAMADYFPYISTILLVIYLVASILPAVIAILLFKVNAPFTIVNIGLTFCTIILSIPFFYMISHWHPCEPVLLPTYRLRTVDILVTTYKEETEVVIGTLRAIQQIDYDRDFLRVYVLDDGRRAELQQICEEMNMLDKNRYPIIYVTRSTNKGRKGGNINNWVKEYDDVASEFFLVLDADMQPFPSMLDTLLGRYYGTPEGERDSIAFVQAPQHFKNHIHNRDPYEIGMTFFFKVVMPCMDRMGVPMYIGTCALWKRQAILDAGGFHEDHATEDSVTGCQVHRLKMSPLDTVPGNWTSRYVACPVAVGISPATLPDLFDQRLRWCLGSVQMMFEHKLFFGAKELTRGQRLTYFGTTGYWVLGLMAFVVTLLSTLILDAVLIADGILAPGLVNVNYPVWLIVIQLLAFFVYFFLLPVASFTEKVRTIQMFCVYQPVYFLALLRYMGVPIKVQSSVSDNTKVKRWHHLFLFHLVILFMTTSLGLVTILVGSLGPAELTVVIYQLCYWYFIYYPVIRSLFGVECSKFSPVYYEDG
uniref:Glycosyltransferase 2-like domain-containing protein n=1 Tax=Compsopogon caeruleus TaxID=31354 RepID=A0A7S1TD31_9RHOD|mmetsp:Transcript_18317/g.38275  ORF Transcript_18317/g.38275 Transcript_18317/m.38275 type:complete len:636 (+) Transcript_18317:381-2288(+)|eukprot:CAMPEP_0184690392 /NCGR_PEP_ID=MMETSP0312-20130426/31201_1 /TAXON_ID=31354 /ORGANISM="Compsopogon coeruleus, Strain SAG 36.94" /LENGTH=635 /DNA_ID=CAMNT_0027147881 /DNA_START=353 /DNA_END=2260 /DNA_ORIENTATION=+